MQTLVCLISKQLEANLYAVIQFKPEQIVLFIPLNQETKQIYLPIIWSNDWG